MDEMSPELQKQMINGKKILDNLNQYKYSPKSKDEMMDLYKFMFEEENIESENNDEINPPVENIETNGESSNSDNSNNEEDLTKGKKAKKKKKKKKNTKEEDDSE